MTDMTAERALLQARHKFDLCGASFEYEIIRQSLSAPMVPDVDSLAQIIREVDGNHSLGAGALAEAIIDRITAAQSPARQHPDDIAVDRFAVAMKKKLATARAKGRGGWDDPEQCSVQFLAELLAEHTAKGNPGNFIDVANFAMMLHMRDADPSVMPAAFNHSTAPAEPICKHCGNPTMHVGDVCYTCCQSPAEPAQGELGMEMELAAKDWVIGNLQLNDRHQEAEIAKLRERVKELEGAFDTLLEEYDDRKAQFGDEFIWHKHEDKHGIERAKAFRLRGGSDE